MKKRLTRRFDPLPGQPGLKASVWVTQSFLAPRYGLSSLELGQLLADEGFREDCLPSQESLASGLAKIHQKEVYRWVSRGSGAVSKSQQMKVLIPVSLWNQVNLVAALKRRGHRTLDDRTVYVRSLGRQLVKDLKPSRSIRGELCWDDWIVDHEEDVKKAKHYIDLVTPAQRLTFVLELRSHLRESGLPNYVITHLFRAGEYSEKLRSHELDLAWAPGMAPHPRVRF